MKARRNIPFCRPGIGELEKRYVLEAMSSGSVKSGGKFSAKCEALLQVERGAAKALLTTSGSTALDLAALVLDIRAGDEVIVPSFTFTATANAFALRGAVPVFADIRADTLTIDADMVSALVTERTRAIACVHYAGVACEMDQIQSIARGHGLHLVEDHAHGPFGSYLGRPLGSLGKIAALSFQEAKNLCAGECGALLVNDEDLLERAFAIWDKGTNRRQFMMGEVPQYEWVELGTNFAPSELLAAMLLAQLEQREEIQRARARVWGYYHENLRAWAGANSVALPNIPAHTQQAFHMFYLLMPDPATRTAFLKHLAENGVQAFFHFSPLHSSLMGRRCGKTCGELPITERVARTIVRLPFYNSLSVTDQDYVIQVIQDFKFPSALA